MRVASRVFLAEDLDPVDVDNEVSSARALLLDVCEVKHVLGELFRKLSLELSRSFLDAASLATVSDLDCHSFIHFQLKLVILCFLVALLSLGSGLLLLQGSLLLWFGSLFLFFRGFLSLGFGLVSLRLLSLVLSFLLAACFVRYLLLEKVGVLGVGGF